MNAYVRYFLAVSAFVMTAALAPTPSFAAYRCDQPTTQIDQRACALAAQDTAALRRFVARTRGIWDLVFEDYVRDYAR
jgi:hypothetical protein